MATLLLKISDVERELGLGKTAIYALLKDGKLDGLKIGFARRITRESCERYVRETLAAQADGPLDLSTGRREER